MKIQLTTILISIVFVSRAQTVRQLIKSDYTFKSEKLRMIEAPIDAEITGENSFNSIPYSVVYPIQMMIGLFI